MAQVLCVRLNKADAPSLGFRLQGGKDFGTPLVVQKVNIGSPAEKSGLLAGDSVIKINAIDVFNLRHKDAQDIIVRAGPSFEITVQRGGSTWQPSVTPLPKVASTNFSPVTKTSLAANPQSSIGSIGTGHNVSAKPFSPQLNGAVNGGPKLVNKQYNTPLGLYSDESIAETLSAQAEVLSTGALGVNFKKNERNYDASNSAVFRMVQEAEKEPRESEPEPDSGVSVVPLNVGGLRHVQAPENKPASTTPQLPPGQNICAECERLIVGVFVRIKDKNLHVECFKCATCGTSLKNVGYYNINQKLYCDVHAKLAARSNPPTPNLVPLLSSGTRAPVGTISAALSSHPLSPSALTPTGISSTGTAQPYQSGTSFSSPRPFASVAAPSVNNYGSLPKSLPVQQPLSPAAPSPGVFSTVKPLGAFFKVCVPCRTKERLTQNIIWPPPLDIHEPDLPTATPVYYPPFNHVRSSTSSEVSKETRSFDQRKTLSKIQKISDKYSNITDSKPEVHMEQRELHNITKNMEAKMSLCSSEIASITSRQTAVETIETAAETQMFVESVLDQKPKSVSYLIKPKVDVQTEPSSALSSQKVCSNTGNMPRVVTSVCVCTDPNCKSDSGKLCESCPMRATGSPRNQQKHKVKSAVSSESPRHGSPIITGVSVTINNPGKIKDLFNQIPDKSTTTALGSALATAPKEPFTPITTSHPEKPVALPSETKPYLPPDRPVTQSVTPKPTPKPIPKPKPQVDTPFVSALRIAPDRSFTPVDKPAVIKKEKPKASKEDPLLKDLPKPAQWMSMVSALTTAPERPYSPFVTEFSGVKETVDVEVSRKEINKISETQQQTVRSSLSNETLLPKPYTQPKKIEKFEPVNDDKVIPPRCFPPASIELNYKADYSEEKSEMSAQTIEKSQQSQILTARKEYVDENITYVTEQGHRTISATEVTESKDFDGNSEKKTEKQTEKAILKKPLELTGYLQKREYLPTYQVNLNYDETLQLPHHKDFKKLLQTDQRKNLQELKLSHSSTSNQFSSERLTNLQFQGSNVSQNVFQPVKEDHMPETSLQRSRPLTPSISNKPPSVLPYYQENLVPSHMPAPEINILDPKSPAISRSPSPCLGQSSGPAGRLVPRPISPAAGPPPNPLRANEFVHKFRKEDPKLKEAKENILGYIPHYREKVDGVESYKSSDQVNSEICLAKKMQDVNTCSELKSNISTSTAVTQQNTCLKRSANFVSSGKVVEATEELSSEGSLSHVRQSTKNSNIGNVNVQTTPIKPQYTVLPQQPEAQRKPFQCSQTCAALKTNNQSNVACSAPPQTRPVPGISISVPTVSQPNTGATGGRQAGAIGVAPKRGRGVLNVGGLIDCRIPMCGHCHSQIRGPFITALGKIWCPEHFVCNTPSCRRQLADLGFVEEQSKLYCEYCFEQYIAPPCSKCGSKIKGDCLKAIGKNFHPECFSCSYCGKLFGNSPFFLEDGQPYCENDWNELFTTKCFACGFPVEAGDRWVEALNNNYHSQCFNCTMCKKNLEGQSFFAKGGRPFCKNHAR